MAVIWSLCYWQHLPQGSPHKVMVFTDHVNLQYYCHPQKINQQVAHYIALLGDYDIELHYLPGIKNYADPLSRRLDHDSSLEDNDKVVALPNKLFIKVIGTAA